MIDAHACTRVLLFAGLAFGAIQRDGTPVNGGKLRSLLGIDLQISARPTLELDGKSVHHSEDRQAIDERRTKAAVNLSAVVETDMSGTHTGSQMSRQKCPGVELSHLPIRSHALLHKRIVIDHLSREIKMNAVLLHDAPRCARFRKRWSVNFRC